MFSIDPINLIPHAFFTKVVDVTVDVMVQVGQGVLDERRLRQIRRLRSDGAFRVAFEEGLRRAAGRFEAEYVHQDEDLVAAIAGDEGFFENEEVQAALLTILQNPGIYLAEERERLAASFDSVLPRRRNRERVGKAVNVFLICLAKEVWALPALRPTYAAHFEHLTANGIQQLISIQKAQLKADEAALALNHDIRAALFALNEGLAQQKLLHDQSMAAQLPEPEQERIRHNLPRPNYEHFVGRKAELAEVRRLLLPSTRHFVVTIDGVGGVGKSALALEVATQYRNHAEQLPEEERFEAIVWATAKQTVLTGEGIRRRSQALRTLDDIYSTIAITLEREEIIRTRSEEQDELVRRVLSKQRVLLIIDNLETVDDERVMTFIREVPAPTKLIVTTRHRVDVAYPIRLLGMSQSEALELIAHEATVKGVRLTKSQAIRLHKRTGGVPLALVWSIAQMGFGYGVPSVLTRLGQPNNDIAKFCFEGAVEGIRDTPAHKLLMALSLFTPDANRDALGYVTNLPELDRDDGLVALEKLSLVNRKEGRFALLPLTKVYSEQELGKDGALEEVFRERWAEWLLEFVTEYSHNRYNTINQVTPEMENILSAIDLYVQKNDFRSVIVLAKGIDFYLWVTGRWEMWNKYIALGLNAAIFIEDTLSEAHFYRTLAAMTFFQGNLDESEHFAKKAVHLDTTHNNTKKLAVSIWRLASVQINKGQYKMARHDLEYALQIAKNIDERHVSRVQRRLAVIDMVEGKYDLAEARLKQAKILREGQFTEHEIPFSSGLSYTYRLLGQLYLLKKDNETARKYIQHSLDMSQRIKNPQNIAEAKLALSKLELRLNRSDLAQILAQEASRIFIKLGMKRQSRETQALLDKIAAQ